jgi:hypothetical protein
MRETMSLSISSTWGRNLSHSWSGHSMSTVARVATKYSLNVVIACSAALTLWLCSGMSWMSILLEWMCFITAFEHLLSMMFYAG